MIACDFYSYGELYNVIKTYGNSARNSILSKYGQVGGHCCEASNLIADQLSIKGIQASVCYGWVIYDFPECCTDEPCEPHYMVKILYQKECIYLDVTATQFQFCISEQIPEVLISKECPYWFVESEEKPMDILYQEFPEWYEE